MNMFLILLMLGLLFIVAIAGCTSRTEEVSIGGIPIAKKQLLIV